jgi:fimbrial chaperone protein
MSRRLIAFLCRVAACGALTAVVPAPVSAGSLQVDPIRLEINAGRRTATLRVRNQDAHPVTIRAYALSWTQAEGEDRYDDTRVVIVSPPIFTIAGGGTQLIRVGLRPPAAGHAAGPAAYRLMVEEVPQASPAGGVQVALRLNIPLFAMMDAGPAAQLAWSAARGADGRWAIEAVNRGPTYVRVEPAAAESATGVDFEANANLGTVLPGSMRRWVIGAQPELIDRARFASIQRANGGADARLSSRGD